MEGVLNDRPQRLVIDRSRHTARQTRGELLEGHDLQAMAMFARRG